MTQLSLLAIDSSRRSLTMMLMLCLKKACRYPKRCAPQRTNQAGKVTTSRTVKKAFSLWWPKSRLSSRVSDGAFVQCGVHMHQIKTCACVKWVVLDLVCLYKSSVVLGRGRPPTEPLPDGWIMTFHNSGIPVYLHRETRVVTWSRPYFLGTGSIRVMQISTAAFFCSCYQV